MAAAACKTASDIDAAASAAASATATVDIVKSSATVATVMAANTGYHDAPADYVWDNASVIPITLNGSSITETTDSAAATGSQLTITSGGTYRLSGTLTNGQIVVNASDQGTVRLILNGVTLSNATTSPLYIVKAQKVVIVLAANTQNTVTDGAAYVFDPATDTEPNAAIFSKADLTFYGTGALTVYGNYNDGIASKDGLVIKSGTIAVNSVDDGIRGKDYLVVKDGTITVVSTGDGFKADNDEEAAKGYVYIESGTVSITAGMDAITAETDAVIAGGTLTLTSGGGSSKTVSGSVSAKGIKGVASVVIGDGTFTISSADDAIHSNASVVVNGGTFGIASGDDGIHADSLLGINGGIISISKSYEGLESAVININDGTIHVTASDDGVNGAGGNDGSGSAGWSGGLPSSGSCYMAMNGGFLAVTAAGDGIDVNGSITMTGGTVIVNGPTSNGNGPLDYDASFKMTGGFIVAAGSSGMAMAPSTSSTQCALLLTFSGAKSAGSMVHIQAADGTEVLTFTPSKTYQSIALCAPGLVKGTSYEVYLGGSSTATPVDGLYTGGTYSGGTKSGSFTVSAIVTSLRI